MKARIRRISASVDTAISFSSSASADATCSDRTCNDLNSSTEMPHGYNPSSKSLDICVPESRLDRMRKLLSSPLLRRRNASQHSPNCVGHSPNCVGHSHAPPHAPHCKHIAPSSSSSSSPSSSPALGSSSTSSMKTFGVSLESLSNHQHPHHQHNNHQRCPEEYYVRDPEQIVVPHQKAAHILGQVCPGCLTSAPSNSSSTGSINDTATTTSSGHFSHHASSHIDDYSMASSIGASSGTSSSSTTSSTSSAGGPAGSPCLIPFIVTRLCNFIENSGGITHEGLFRISGNAKLIEKLKQSFDLTGDAPLETEGDLASAAALLKQFLRELPQPLIPNGLQFLDVIRSLKSDHDTCVLSLKALVSQLPDENYYTLRYLIRFLHRIAQRNDENRMTSSNLGIVFAPNIIRVCVDNIQSLKDQNLANEVVNFLITEFGDIFNESCEVGYPSGTNLSSREDLCSCESEPSCPYATCHIEIVKSELQQSHSTDGNLLLTIESAQKTTSSALSILVSGEGKSSSEERVNDDAIMELDRKRKDYKSKNHRTIDEFDDDRCQSFDCGLAVKAGLKQYPQRCNSDGNSEELASTGSDAANLILNINEDTLRRQAINNTTHEIIITNSSDSVSTDDNTTTTATSTGATVCSVVAGQLTARGIRPSNNNERHLSSSDDNPEKSSSLGTSELKLLCCDNVMFDSNLKTGRSGSCGSDCTENMNIPASLSFTSDDEEDSLSKSIASDCSGSSSTTSSSCSSSHMSADNEAGSSSSLNENGNDNNNQMETDRHVAAQHNIHLLQHKPWSRSGEDQRRSEENNSPQLSQRGPQNSFYERSIFDFISNTNDPSGEFSLTVDTQMTIVCEEAPVSPSAYRSYLSTKLDETALPPSPPVTNDAAIYAMKHRNQHHFSSSVAYESLDARKATTASRPVPTAKVPGLKSRNKRLQSLRRKLRQFNQDFEGENGYRPTYEHKMASSFARPLMMEMSSLLNVGTKQLRDLEDPENEAMVLDEEGTISMNLDNMSTIRPSNNNWKYCSEMAPSAPLNSEDIFNTIFGNPKEKSLAKIEEMMNEIQRTLIEKRVSSNRPESLDEMTSEQIFDEKLALQKALLRFEALFGRPDSKAQRDIVRPVYDRYRMVKRYAARMIQKLGSKDVNSDLQPIIEHVQMDFKSPTHSRTVTESKSPTEMAIVPVDKAKDKDCDEKADSKNAEAIPDAELEQPASASASASPTVIDNCPTIVVSLNQKPTCDNMQAASSSVAESAKSFHEMSHEELLIQVMELRQQKRNLRAVLRTFENDFLKKTGRRVEKEDRCNMSSVYHCYKNTKGKIRLLEALVAKTARERNECQKNV